MSTKKTASRTARVRKARGRAQPADIRKAIAQGRRRGKEVLALRKRQRIQRARAVAAVARSQVASPATARRIKPQIIVALGQPSAAGVLIAEGDSWFDYPFYDILSKLEDEHGFDIESVAHSGDRIENMAFAGGQLEKFCRRLEKLLRSGNVPRAILLSGGGNDVAGDQFGMLLNHASSPIAGLNNDIVTGVIDKRIKTALASVISAITTISDNYVRDRIPIVTHGYAHAIPDGRGVGGFLNLSGPWLKPGFDEKGFEVMSVNTAIIEDLIDRFNSMVKSVAAQFPHVHYVDLRPILRNDSQYRKSWGNELHPTQNGFSLVADEFAKVIAALP